MSNFMHALKSFSWDFTQTPKKAERDFRRVHPALGMLLIFALIFLAVGLINGFSQILGSIYHFFI